MEEANLQLKWQPKWQYVCVSVVVGVVEQLL